MLTDSINVLNETSQFFLIPKKVFKEIINLAKNEFYLEYLRMGWVTSPKKVTGI